MNGTGPSARKFRFRSAKCGSGRRWLPHHFAAMHHGIPAERFRILGRSLLTHLFIYFTVKCTHNSDGFQASTDVCGSFAKRKRPNKVSQRNGLLECGPGFQLSRAVSLEWVWQATPLHRGRHRGSRGGHQYALCLQVQRPLAVKRLCCLQGQVSNIVCMQAKRNRQDFWKR